MTYSRLRLPGSMPTTHRGFSVANAYSFARSASLKAGGGGDDVDGVEESVVVAVVDDDVVAVVVDPGRDGARLENGVGHLVQIADQRICRPVEIDRPAA